MYNSETEGCAHWREHAASGMTDFHSFSINGTIFYCVECLWAATARLPMVVLDKSELWLAEEDVAWDEGTWESLKDDNTSEHFLRVGAADLSYPIIVMKDEDKYKIMDGTHRFLASGETLCCRIAVREMIEALPVICNLDEDT